MRLAGCQINPIDVKKQKSLEIIHKKSADNQGQGVESAIPHAN